MTPRSDLTRFIRRVVVAMCAVILLLAGFNAWADPFGIVGTGRYRVVSLSWLERTYKAELMRRLDAAPQLVVLGSSTIVPLDMRAAPELQRFRSFNAAVAAGTPADAYVTTGYLMDRFRSRPPKLLYALDVGSMAQSAPNVAIIQNPELLDQLSPVEQGRLVLRAYQPIFDLRRVPLSIRTIRLGSAGELAPVNQLFRPDGTRRSYEAFYTGIKVTSSRYRQRALDVEWDIPSNTGRFDELDPDQVDLLRRMLDAANAGGVRPTIYLPPVEPSRLDRGRGVSEDPTGYWSDWNDRRFELVRLLEREQRRREFEFYDLSDIREVGGDPTGFEDYVHADLDNLIRTVRYLDRRGALD